MSPHNNKKHAPKMKMNNKKSAFNPTPLLTTDNPFFDDVCPYSSKNNS